MDVNDEMVSVKTFTEWDDHTDGSVCSLLCGGFPSFGCQASSKERFVRIMFVVGLEQWNHQLYVFERCGCPWP